ncbi:Dna2/Cas4 domain-containing protein [Telmatospirillum sp. J64-1]|uniref:Dna2/Cas4 domain-containing protein n=1 Tax=Telmatospirillum sp. J64-1 TaxID=2502183 RepID=UPI00163D6E0B|nr:Dna2/Cas4 domain-containing protein [Telmatospirillum sp. J64-1]
MHIQHAAICARRCWLHLHRASMNEWSENIRLGFQRHADSHGRDRSTAGLLGLHPDRLDWEAGIVIEEKTSASYLEASMDQAAFYAALMSRATGRIWSARLYVMGSKRYHEVSLDPGRVERLERALDLIETLKRATAVPAARPISACRGCSNNEFCGFAE